MNRKAFSLVELLVVVAIIGILAVILVPNVQENLKRAKVAQTKAMISSIEMAVVTYENDFGQYPESFDPQQLFIAVTAQASAPYEPDSDEFRLYDQGQQLWINPDSPTTDERRQNLLSQGGVPPRGMLAQTDENVFIDSWGNPLYYVSSDVYNPSGRADYRRRGSSSSSLDNPVAYEMRNGERHKPFNPVSFQIISFGPDGATLPPDTLGGIGSMLGTDGVDNDNDEFTDHLDQVRNGDRSQLDPEVLAEDDITNFM